MHIPGRPNPTTFEYIEAVALREPQRPALVQDGQGWTYERLYAGIVRAIRVIDELGVKRGDRVAIGTSGFQAGMVLLIAAENLGAVTASFNAAGDPNAQALFAIVDWVISDVAQDVPANAREIRIDADFVRRLDAVNLADPRPLPRVALALHEPQRISRTSGSSGHAKFMLLARQAQENWVRTGAENGGYRPESRLLVAGPLVMNAIFARSSACLRMGACVLDLQRGPAGHDISHILALPRALEEIIDALPRGYTSRQRVEVGAIGGFVPPQLRERAARTFGGRISSRYGANEVTGICDDLDANGVGVISAGVDLKVIDEAGNDVPAGQLGMIAVRTPGMAESYIGDPEGSQAAFRDGWFHTGDWGALLAPRVLRLAGRFDDLINAGGLKVPASDVEAQVRDIAQPQDCAVLSVNLEGGQITLGIALVMDGTPSRDDVRRRLGEGLKLGATVGAKVIFLRQLPRQSTGKVDRVALHRLFEAPPADSL